MSSQHSPSESGTAGLPFGEWLPDDGAELSAALVIGNSTAATEILKGAKVGRVIQAEQPAKLEQSQPEFDLIFCSRDALQGTTNPIELLTASWKLALPDAILLLESRILDQPGCSRYARFLGSKEAEYPGGEWVPGRLTLRWMVEASGFDVERWLNEGALGDGGAAVTAALQARRSERAPEILSQ